jgi:hypothetical protein
MRSIPLVLVIAIGCTASDPDPADFPEAMAVEAVTACATGTWCVESPPGVATATLLHGVWAVTANDVFAVGDGGTILRRTNDVWTAMTTPTTSNLRGVWGSSSTDVWAGGVTGTLLHFDGTAWTLITLASTADIDAVWGSGSTDVWFAGSGTVTHWNGTGFSSTGFGGALLSISGTGPRDVWVAGENANLHHWNGSAWATVTPISGVSTYFAVLALSPSDVWASDFTPNKETAHWNGSKWTPLHTGTGSAMFNGMSALASNDVWGAGGSRVAHWDGAAWTPDQPFGTSASLWSIITTAGNAWVVGNSGLIAHRSL